MSDFVICIDNGSNPASLIVGKVYRRLPDADAESHAMLRVVDEDDFDRAISASADKLSVLAREALAEHRAGQTRELDPDQL